MWSPPEGETPLKGFSSIAGTMDVTAQCGVSTRKLLSPPAAAGADNDDENLFYKEISKTQPLI